MIDEQQWQAERDWLARVYAVLVATLKKAKGKASDIYNDTLTLQRQMWEDVGTLYDTDHDVGLSAQYLDALRTNKAIYGNNDQIVQKLTRMEQSAYFGRVDFVRQDKSLRNTYIGISTLFDPATMEILVCDWRAPIGSLFYEQEPGPVAYEGPQEVIRGTLTGKRQYTVQQDRLLRVIDTELVIGDEMLREALSRHSDAQMHAIVSTIQQHQNQVIRQPLEQHIVVQGVAGSGKTAVALHRVAWLLYRYRKQDLTSRQLLLFTPNRPFVEYIRDVLPELGEQNIPTATLHTQVRGLIPGGYKVETPWAAMEYLLRFARKKAVIAQRELRAALAGKDMVALLEQYAGELAAAPVFEDVVHDGKVLVTARELMDLYAHRPQMPMAKRLLRVIRRVLEALTPLYRQQFDTLSRQHRYNGELNSDARRLAGRRCQELFAPATQTLARMTRLRTREAFAGFWPWLAARHPLGQRWMEHDETVRSQQYLPVETACLYAMLRVLLYGPPAHGFRHVVIDEAQDYTPLQTRLIQRMLEPAGFTILMDRNQHIQPHLPMGLEAADVAMSMDVSYRATRQLTEFTRALLPQGAGVEAFDRPGTPPRLIRLAQDALAPRLAADLAAWGRESRVAVITRTAHDAQQLYPTLHALVPELRLLTAEDSHPAAAMTLLPSWLSKGLEFDVVLVVHPESYGPDECGLFYTVCTRAQHELSLYTTRPGYRPAAPEALYTVEEG